MIELKLVSKSLVRLTRVWIPFKVLTSPVDSRFVERKFYFMIFTFLLVVFSFLITLGFASDVAAIDAIIVDDDDPLCRFEGFWLKSPYGSPLHGWKHISQSGTGMGSAKWSPILPDGRYRVLVHINTGDYSTQAVYTVRNSTGSTSVSKSQNHLPTGWSIDLGEFDCLRFLEVSLSDDSSHGIVVADALQFSPVLSSDTNQVSSDQRSIRDESTAPNEPKDATDRSHEFRGIWVTRWDYHAPEDVIKIMEKAAQSHFNAVFFQVRGRADAFYRSELEPWAEELTGKLGVDPGWDPLETAVKEAHERGLELHAWMNMLTCWSGLVPPPKTKPRHIFLSHPKWLQTDRTKKAMKLNDHYVFVSPANLELRNHLIAVCTDIANRYAVDGFHFDYIRYAGRDYANDEKSEKRYFKSMSIQMDHATWLRQSLNELVSLLYQSIIAVRSDLKITAAVWGIYKDKWQWNTSEGYSSYYQDSSAWLSGNYIDAICPMIYWQMNSKKPPHFETLVADFADNMNERHVYAGISCEFEEFSKIYDMIIYTRNCNLPGVSLFAYSYLESHNFWSPLRDKVFKETCLTPDMPWKSKSHSPK